MSIAARATHSGREIVALLTFKDIFISDIDVDEFQGRRWAFEAGVHLIQIHAFVCDICHRDRSIIFRTGKRPFIAAIQNEFADEREAQWIPMDKKGEQWIPMDKKREQYLPMDKKGEQWIPMDKEREQCLPKDKKGEQWTPIDKRAAKFAHHEFGRHGEFLRKGSFFGVVVFEWLRVDCGSVGGWSWRRGCPEQWRTMEGD